jgi:MFS family permease
MKRALDRWRKTDIHLRYFLIGILFLGINAGILSTAFNNYLNDLFKISPEARGNLEFPRELPGFILIGVTGLLAGYSMRTWAVLVGILSAVGVFGLGFFSPTVLMMVIWMVISSMGDHLYMPVESTMGLYLAKEGKQGKRLGQIAGARNLAMIFGALAVSAFALFFSGKLLYQWLFLISASCAALSIWSFAKVDVHADKKTERRRFVFRSDYKFFYALNVLFGARKQVFLTFAPWVLVTVFNSPPATMGFVIMIASIAGVVFRQVFGIVVDRFGEKKMFIADSLILFGICAGFAFSKNIYLLYFLYIIDNLMFSTRIARTTYLNKIAHNKSDIPATISLGITMDHMISMTVPTLGGLLWAAHDYSWVFIAASFVSLAGLFVALIVKVPKHACTA